MGNRKQRLELTWIGKDERPHLEPRILLEDGDKSYRAEAHAISTAMRQLLWMPEHGAFAESKDWLGEQTLSESPAMWTLYHAIDETSPLYHMDREELVAADAVLVLNLGGVDDSSAQRLAARKVYSAEDIRWRHRYVDITGDSSQGRLLLDYTKFHDVIPEATSGDG